MAAQTEAPSTLSKTFAFGSTAVATVSLIIGAALSGSWRTALGAAAVGVLSAVAISREWGRPVGGLSFAGLVSLAVGAVLAGTHPLWSLLGVTAALVSWDLHTFRSRLASVDTVTQPGVLVRKHLRRLAVVALIGFGLGAAAVLVRVNYGIATVVGLAVLAALGLSQVISQLRRDSD